MKFEISKYWQLLFSLLILIFSFSILAYLIFAWSPPTGQYPPLKNVPAPINVGDQDQVKSGGLGANTLAIARGAVFAYQGGNVGIGTTAPSQKLDVAGYVRGSSGLCIGNNCRTSWPSTVTLTDCAWTDKVNTGAGGSGIDNPNVFTLKCPAGKVMTAWKTVDDDTHPTRAYCCSLKIQ